MNINSRLERLETAKAVEMNNPHCQCLNRSIVIELEGERSGCETCGKPFNLSAISGTVNVIEPSVPAGFDRVAWESRHMSGAAYGGVR